MPTCFRLGARSAQAGPAGSGRRLVVVMPHRHFLLLAPRTEMELGQREYHGGNARMNFEEEGNHHTGDAPARADSAIPDQGGAIWH
jgi:hypothetical protein